MTSIRCPNSESLLWKKQFV